MVEALQNAKLVLLGEMGCGKTSLVQRYVRGQYYEHQARSEPCAIDPKMALSIIVLFRWNSLLDC